MPTPTGAECRLAAGRAVAGVIDDGKALHELFPKFLAPLGSSRERALARRLASQALRSYNALDQILAVLLRKPLPRKERLVHHLLVVGVAQLRGSEIPPHAAVNATVEACKLAGRRHLADLVNGVLKEFQRRAGEFGFEHSPALLHGYPEWWVTRARADWPEVWQELLDNGNQPPPLVLRVNRRRACRNDYVRQLAEVGIGARALPHLPDAVQLDHPLAIRNLPGFDAGLISVQDGGAQLAATVLDLHDGLRVLDACAAPGGKTGHILETADVDLTALDQFAERVDDIHENLRRLGLSCRVATADAACPEQWWDGQPFDRILIDAPCSSSGVVRRHPDVRWLRRESDLAGYVTRQRSLADALWPLLKPGGMLVYCTCSVFRCENQQQGAALLEAHEDAEELVYQNFDFVTDARKRTGVQILPNEHGMDGFFYFAARRRLH